MRLFPAVSRLYFDDEGQRGRFPGRSLWSLNNAFSQAVKELRQGPRYNAGVRIGRMFGRILRRAGTQAGPIAAFDELDRN